MLHNVPQAINRMARNMVINHPNTWSCTVLRPKVTRAGGDLAGGLPTLGGMAVLSSEDEESVEWDFVGYGFALEAEPFNPSSMADRQDANLGQGNEFRYLIEPEAAPGTPEWFDLKKRDVVFIDVHEAVKLAFEIVDIETTVNIAPFTNRYVVNRRDDLHQFG